jgi:hypothetical protein
MAAAHAFVGGYPCSEFCPQQSPTRPAKLVAMATPNDQQPVPSKVLLIDAKTSQAVPLRVVRIPANNARR